MSGHSSDSEVEVLRDDFNTGSFRFHNGYCSRQNQEENDIRPIPELIPLFNGDPAGEPLGNDNNGLDQAQEALHPASVL